MMKDLKLTFTGVIAVALLAAFCAGSLFVTLMLLVARPNGDASSGSAAASLPAPTSEASESAALPSPAVTPPPVGPTRQAEADVTHTVRSGENLFRISMAYGVTVADIMAANGLFDSRFITAGQVLRIPVDRAVAPPAGRATAVPSVMPEPTLTSKPVPLTIVNGLSLDSILVMPEKVRQNALRIYARGQELGRSPRAYAKLGDSTIENPHFMARFDEGPYDLGDYAYLQAAIDHFSGSHGRQGLGVRRGFHSWTVTDPAWADKSVCLANESPVACEIRVHNPSVMLVRLGSNDAGVPAGFEQNLRQVIDIAVENGVIPVLGTKADRFEGSNINNEILRRLAVEYQLPLWDFDLVASTIPGRGLDVDGVHLTTFYAHDYTSPAAFQRGHGLHNLTALMVLDAIWRQVLLEADQ